MALLGGMATGWTSPALAILLSPQSPILMSKAEGSWVGSLLNIGRALGAFVGALDVEFFGSKTAVLHIGFVQAASSIFLVIPDSLAWLYTSRFIGGIAVGMFYISFPLYIGEIANPKIRGSLVGLISNGMSLGYVLGNVTGAHMSIPAFAWLTLAITIVFLISFVWLPKSPHQLVLSGRLDEAGEAMRWYQRDIDVTTELPALQSFVQDRQSMTFKHLLKEFMLPHNRIALLKVNMVYILMQLSGLYTVGFYMQIILRDAKVTVVDPATAVIIISIIGLVGGWFAVFAVDRYGRKRVLSTAAAGLAISLSAMAVHYEMLARGVDPIRFQWFMISASIALEACINLGIVPIPSTILSEIFAPNIKSYCSCIANITSGLVAFAVTQTYQMLIDAIDYNVYYIYAGSMVLLAVFTMTQLPETKGKSLQEIQNMLMKKNPEKEKSVEMS